MKALVNKKYETPTPIQEQAIPVALEGRDLLGLAQTGTGKTAAFAIPIIQQLDQQMPKNRKREIQALILTPTRELAIQIDECFRDYAKYTSVRHTVIFGGVNQRSQVEQLQSGVDVLVATPGRLLDLINQKYISLSHIRHFVLDEVDRMLDMGFVHDIKRLLPMLPKQKQCLFFSATMPVTIANLSKSILYKPVRIEVAPVSSVVDTIHQRLYFVENLKRANCLSRFWQRKRKRRFWSFQEPNTGRIELPGC